MSTAAPLQSRTAKSQPSSNSTHAGLLLQRKCACGQHTGNGGECESCRKEREGMLQREAISSPPVSEVPPIVHDVLRSPGFRAGEYSTGYLAEMASLFPSLSAA